MKRELKVVLFLDIAYQYTRCSPNPYEEGTESYNKLNNTKKKIKSCSPNPYEEGTESLLPPFGDFLAICAAAQIPMKRELKGRT